MDAMPSSAQPQENPGVGVLPKTWKKSTKRVRKTVLSTIVRRDQPADSILASCLQ